MKILEEKASLDFNQNSKKYNVNVFNHSRMVHMKNGCYYSHLYKFIPFNSIEEIEQFEKEHSWWSHVSGFQNLLQNYTNQNSMILA